MAQEIDAHLDCRDWIPASADCYQTLNQTTLDLWRIPLAQPIQLDTLSEDELTRFKRYRFADDQRKFAVARSSLRQILALYSQQRPVDLAFDYGPYGKPYLRNNGSLQFNLSHSGEYALCGVARQGIGLDIELLRPMDRLEGLIKRCLAPYEQENLAQIPLNQQSNAFLKYWTCKEAYLKATGQGISESLTAIEVSFTPYPQLKVPNQPWQLQVFIPCEGYTAAVVMPLEITQIRLHQL
ncbi:4'-phosphopantetheinyl transferase family protein [Leptothoe spongobia]|uniref:4'-phosphopantetheinyl transferase superfamily protein n=1 Tax=Leptothoe spongobia TAU-MAC 1115 TaxID=1967444 RepID=A0A947DG19_9CYAN|nr:4'-phosphopantetheinyl transferase superfamily protein [Leptothoe spongobia]MBT9316388.1 4'-phosphopantetheinyl transferase superfamily protein [Leptothoe spongobia TAU-MAC 1115]